MLFIILCGFVVFTTGRFMFSLASCFVLFLQSCFSIVITSLGEEGELVYMLLVHLFVYFARIYCPFSLPLGVRGWPRFVTVALPGVF